MTTSATPKLPLQNVCTSQPQRPTGIDWTNPVCRGLMIAVNAAGYNFAQAKVAIQRESAFSWVRGTPNIIDTGIANASVAGHTCLVLVRHPSLSGSNPETYLTNTVAGNNGFTFSTDSAVGSYPNQTLRLSLTHGGVAQYSSITDISGANTSVLPLAFSATVSGSVRFFAQGLFLDSVATGAINQNSSTLRIGGRPWFSDYYANYDLPGLFYWNRALSDAEIKTISDNPWQIFQSTNTLLSATLIPHEVVTPRKSYMLGATNPGAASAAIIAFGKGNNIRSSQPQGVARIAYSNPITRGLIFVSTPTLGPINLVNGLQGTATNVVNLLGTKGVAQSVNGGGLCGYQFAQPMNLTTGKSYSLLSFSAPVANTNRKHLLSAGVQASPYYQIQLTANFDQVLAASVPGRVSFWDYAGGTQFQYNSDVANGLPHVFVATRSADIGLPAKLYIDGKLGVPATTAIDSGAAEGGNSAYIGVGNDAGYSGTTRNCVDPIYLSCIWLRALTPTEIKSISDNPWQIFAPDNQPVFGRAI